MDTAAAKRVKDDSPVLPAELVEEILSYLPAKSLRRFECLSTSWRQVITSPAFQDLHYKRARHRLFIRPEPEGMQSFYAWQPNEDGVTVVEEIMGPCFYNLPQGRIFPVTKSCRGLVILRCLKYNTFYVWNPSAGDIFKLPDTRTKDTFCCYGMGYCSTTNRYKVVRMYNLGVPAGERRTVCEVFTLGESAYWRPSASMTPPSIRVRHDLGQGAVLSNGNLHFIGHDGVIMTFNVTEEMFGTLMPPQGLGQDKDDYSLTELDNCLCVYSSWQYNPKLECPYKIWLLRDYEAGCWEKLTCIDWGSMPEAKRTSLGSRWIGPLGMYSSCGGTGNTKKIMFGTGKCQVFVADPSNGVPQILFSLDGTQNSQDAMFPTMGLLRRASIANLISSPSSLVWWVVLTRLPERMVARLTQVSREWRAMTKDELFIDKHLLHANLNKSPQVMFADVKVGSFKLVENFINTSEEPPMVDGDAIVVCSSVFFISINALNCFRC